MPRPVQSARHGRVRQPVNKKHADPRTKVNGGTRQGLILVLYRLPPLSQSCTSLSIQ
jgi:hypothetical protein